MIARSFFLLFLLVFTACQRVKNEAKAAVNKTGEAVGQAASEFGKGVAEGIDKTFACTLQLGPNSSARGLSYGKFSLEDGAEGRRNVLSAYLIFAEDFSAVLTAKVFDPQGREYGRISQQVEGKKGEARFVDFIFDNRTHLENNSKLVLE